MATNERPPIGRLSRRRFIAGAALIPAFGVAACADATESQPVESTTEAPPYSSEKDLDAHLATIGASNREMQELIQLTRMPNKDVDAATRARVAEYAADRIASNRFEEYWIRRVRFAIARNAPNRDAETAQLAQFVKENAEALQKKATAAKVDEFKSKMGGGASTEDGD
jgi:hypothetical protein